MRTARLNKPISAARALLALGLWDYAQALRAKGETFFIPHRPQDLAGTPRRERKNHPEKMAGRQWGIWVGKCGITDLHNANAGHAAIKRSVGHTGEGMTGVHAGYVRGIELANLQTVVELLKHSQVNFKALKLADPTFSAFFAKQEVMKKEPEAVEIDERNRGKRKGGTI